MAKGFCRRHYQMWTRTGNPYPTRKCAEERFWEKVDLHGPVPQFRPELGVCWTWTGAVNIKGYSRFGVAVRMVDYGHTYSYRLHYGAIPRRLVIDHLCRVRHCVRPSHLELVSNGENIRRGIRDLKVERANMLGIG